MAIPLSRVSEVLYMLKGQDAVFANDSIPESFCRFGVIQAGISLKKDFSLYSELDTNDKEIYFITGNISDKEIYLAGVYSYRNFALRQHDELTRKAINFKTISFAVSGLTERAKEAMRIVWWCDSELSRILNDLSPLVGNASEMGGTS